jgi:hypothetical protein
MPGLVPGIYVLTYPSKVVDGRDKPGHDVEFGARSNHYKLLAINSFMISLVPA